VAPRGPSLSIRWVFALVGALAVSDARLQTDPLRDARRRVEQLAADAARAGLPHVTAICLEQLPRLGCAERELARVRARLERELGRPRSVPAPRVLDRLDDAARAAAAAIAGAAAPTGSAPPGAASAELFACALAFDADCDAAHAGLGHVRAADGRSYDPATAALVDRRHAMAQAMQRARALEIPVTLHAATDRALLQVSGGRAAAARYGELQVESTIDGQRLVQLVREAVRAMAWANWLVTGMLEPVVAPGVFVHVHDQPAYDAYLAAARAAGRVSAEQAQDYAPMAGFWLPPPADSGYAGAALLHRGGTGEVGGILLMYFDLSVRRAFEDGEFGDTVTPHWAKLGHCQFVALSVLGGAIPSVVVRDAAARTSSTANRPETRLPNAGLVGCRSWMRKLAAEGAAPPLGRCLTDQGGKLQGDLLLRATLSVAYLHEIAEMAAFHARCERVWRQPDRPPPTDPERAAAVLGRPLAEFDAAWERWLLDGGHGTDVRRAIRATAAPAAGPAATVLADLNARRAAAGLEPVALDAELSEGAALHARYLETHPAQKVAWPDAHDEYPESEAFTPAGAWAGARSVIAFDGAERCLDEWFGTFYHRVPLTHPGLLGIGLGTAGSTTVLDCLSLQDPTGTYESRYPWDGQRGVPRRFRSELPNPVPERADQSTLGYPITLQIGPSVRASVQAMRLLRGDHEVECFWSTPTAPTNPRLAPVGCYCLIPKAPLDATTTYTVEVVWPEQTNRWSFTTGR
jgi:hypothetical protein